MNLDFNPHVTPRPDFEDFARQLRESGSLADAAFHYDKAAQWKPQDPRVLIEAGVFADELGDAPLAVARLRSAASLPGDHRPEALAALARALMHAGDFVTAGGVWWRLARRGEQAAEAWAGLAICAWGVGRLRLVRRVERRIEGRASRDQIRLLMARLWLHAAGAMRPRQEAALHVRRSPLMELLRETTHTLDRHASRHPDRADAHYHRAICHEALGQRSAAHGAVNRALQLNPRYTAAHEASQRMAA